MTSVGWLGLSPVAWSLVSVGSSAVGLWLLGLAARRARGWLRVGVRLLASTSAAIWMAVMLIFFAVFPWWGRLVVGSLLVAHIWLTTRSQMWGTVSAAYVLRKTAEADGAGQEVRP